MDSDQMSDFITQRIAATQAQIIAYEDAITALSAADMAVQSYTLNTGQTVQTVTRRDLATMQTTLDALYNRYATLQARATGSGVTIVGPGW